MIREKMHLILFPFRFTSRWLSDVGNGISSNAAITSTQ
jgi:hypothetical protein